MGVSFQYKIKKVEFRNHYKKRGGTEKPYE